MTFIQINRESGIPQSFNNEAFDEMLNQYKFMPNQYWLAQSGTSYYPIDECSKIVRELVDLKPGQSTPSMQITDLTTHIIDRTLAAKKALRQYLLENVIDSNWKIFKIKGLLLNFKHVISATKNSDNGCTVHHQMEVSYSGSEESILSRWRESKIELEDVDISDVAQYIEEISKEIGTPFETKENQIRFLKAVRDDHLIRGVNLSHMTDEDLETYESRNIGIDHYDVSRFILKHAGIDESQLMNCIVDTYCSDKIFDTSRLDFTFNCDVTISGDTFKTFYTIADSIDEYDAKPEVLSKLKNDYIDNNLYGFDLEELADQIIEGRKSISQYLAEAYPEDINQSTYFDDIEESATCDEYIFRSQGGYDGYEVVATRQGDKPIYDFEISTKSSENPYETYIKLGKGTYKIGSRKLDSAFKCSTLVNRLADLLDCSVSELPRILTDKGIAKFDEDDFSDYESPDESEVYNWFESYATNSDICRVIEEANLLPDLSDLHCVPFSKFQIDFTDCIPEELYKN